jgi:hypothetical protein
VAEKRQQESIKAFRKKCKLLPHPIEFFSKKGIQVPVSSEYAALFVNQVFIKNLFPRVKDYLTDNFIEDRTNHVIFPFLPVYPEPFKHRFSNGFSYVKMRNAKVVIGVLVLSKHMVFFEARFDGNKWKAIVIDPNGKGAELHRLEAKGFFEDVPVTYLPMNYANTSDRKSYSVLKTLGMMQPQNIEISGFCSTISYSFMIDYVCTQQWNNGDEEVKAHFIRSTQEWIVSPEESSNGVIHNETTMIRKVFLGRYIAYRIAVVILKMPERETRKASITMKISKANKSTNIYNIESVVMFGDKQVTLTGVGAQRQLTSTNDDGVARILVF